MRSRPRLQRLLIFVTIMFVLLVFVTNTNPDNLPVGILVVPILLVFFAGFLGTLLLCDLFRIFPQHTKKRRSLAATIATMLAIGVVVGSSGAIVLSDFVLIVLIIVVAILYISNF